MSLRTLLAVDRLNDSGVPHGANPVFELKGRFKLFTGPLDSREQTKRGARWNSLAAKEIIDSWRIWEASGEEERGRVENLVDCVTLPPPSLGEDYLSPDEGAWADLELIHQALQQFKDFHMENFSSWWEESRLRLGGQPDANWKVRWFERWFLDHSGFCPPTPSWEIKREVERYLSFRESMTPFSYWSGVPLFGFNTGSYDPRIVKDWDWWFKRFIWNPEASCLKDHESVSDLSIYWLKRVKGRDPFRGWLYKSNSWSKSDARNYKLFEKSFGRHIFAGNGKIKREEAILLSTYWFENVRSTWGWNPVESVLNYPDWGYDDISAFLRYARNSGLPSTSQDDGLAASRFEECMASRIGAFDVTGKRKLSTTSYSQQAEEAGQLPY